MKYEIKMFIIALALILLLPIGVKANDETDSIMRRLAPDLENAVFKMKKPTTQQEGDFNVTGYVANLLGGDYWVYASCLEPYDTCTINFQSHDYDAEWNMDSGEMEVISGWAEEYTVNATWEAPTENSTINSYVEKLNEADMGDPTTYYIVSDLSLINYYLTGSKSELWNVGASGRALKFSSLNEITKGSDITYYIDIRAGNQDKDLMFESAFGPMSIFYNGFLYNTVEEGVYLRRVIYVPESTTDSQAAFVAAAQERITDYLGNNSVTVSYGGTLEELNTAFKESQVQKCLESGFPEEECDIEYMDGAEDEEFPVESDGNYYIVTIGDRTYNFYIIKGTEEQLKAPTYTALNIESKIELSSTDSSIPLDASLTVTNVDDSTIGDKVGTDNYVAYDIKVHSDAKEADITKLSNGKFLVRIPVPEELKDKDELTVWYIPSSGEKEEHTVTPKTIEGKLYAEFETNHFSTYVLAEAVEEDKEEQTTPDEQENTPNVPGNGETEDNSKTEDNPKTGDNIINYFVLFTISLIVFSCSLVYKFELNK